MTDNLFVLLIGDNPCNAELIRKTLTGTKTNSPGSLNFELYHAKEPSEGLDFLINTEIDVVLLNLKLPDEKKLNTFHMIHNKSPHVPVILLSNKNDKLLAIQSVRQGAQDYLVKAEIEGNLLIRAIQYAIERKRFAEAIATEKESLGVTLRSIGDGVITTDKEGKIVRINKVAEKLTGWLEDDAIGKSSSEIFNILNEKTYKTCKNPIKTILKTGSVYEINSYKILISRDGTEKIITYKGAVLHDKENNNIGVVLIFHDNTMKRKMEEELLKIEKLESIGILAGGIAHDFNNILVPIMGNLSLAKLRFDKEDEIFEMLTDAEKAAVQAKNLVKQLITFARGGSPVKETTSIIEIIQDTAIFTLRGSNIQCNFSLDEDLWSVDVDGGQLSHVINNLIINSCQAMPEGGTIDVKAANINIIGKHPLPIPKGEYIKLTITDHGIGIPDKNLKKIFDPYFTTKENGSGLNLAICYSIIKNHNGYISLDTKEGEGTSFYIYLPAAGENINHKNVIEDIHCSGKKRILIMDDEEMIRKVTGKMLQSFGYEAGYAQDGDEAIKLYKEAKNSINPYDAVLMDLTIPGGMGGKEAVKILLEIDPDLKAIVSSGHSNDTIMTNHLEHGFSGFILKPYKIQELQNVLQKILSEDK